MAEWSSSYITALPDSAFACVDADGRHYPHHNAQGILDMPHLRNAMSRLGQAGTTSCGRDHLQAHAKAAGIGMMKSADEQPVERAVKFIGPDTIEGLAIPFAYDTDGETFTPATDFCLDWFGKSGRPVLYDHGLDAPESSVIGRQEDFEERADGIWAKSQLQKNRRYRKAIDHLIEEGALGYSTGAMAHLAKKNRAGEITRWPWVELSLTPYPAHPATMVHYVKSADFIRRLEETDQSVPAPVKAALAALDEWAESNDESLPDGLKFAEHADRLLADVEAFRERTGSLVGLRAKAGRVLSATTRERLMRHPASLRELADDLDGLLAEADAGKSADLLALSLDYERVLARLAGVELPAEGVPA